ncbi:hypothetical protein EI94DRAFT_1735594 [Lactarius quietus]|nr:hypothetical protein EI94DRAFT_1735594 [Lactarius quietus]
MPHTSPRTHLIARSLERSIPTDDDNPKLQLRNDDIRALPMISDVNLLFEASLRRPRVRGQSLNS